MKVIDSKDLRKAFGSFATGVTVVTTESEGNGPIGFTANSFTSVSLDPPLLLVCLAHGMRSFPVFEQSAHFAVNILADDQQDISGTFASRGADKFASVRWRAGHTGSPLLEGVVAWFDCEVHQRILAGDHTILIGRIVDYAYENRAPLGFCGGGYLRFGLLQQAVESSHRHGRVRVGAVLECAEGVLLEEHPDTGGFSVPAATRLGSVSEQGGLFGKFAEAGYSITLPFLFAVYEEADTQFVIHRGSAIRQLSSDPISRPQTSSLCPFSMDAIPWDKLSSSSERMMLERYQRERATNVTGIYVGTAESGDLHTVTATRPLS
jgi:flavin reductase (DIM6/NTAB) family NADH-FMN oxidoreductase RutF